MSTPWFSFTITAEGDSGLNTIRIESVSDAVTLVGVLEQVDLSTELDDTALSLALNYLDLLLDEIHDDGSAEK